MKVLDITDKLKAQEQPVLKIKDVELPVNDDAITLLTVMELMDGGNPSMLDIKHAAELIFGEEGLEKLASLKLNMDNFMEVVSEAMDIVTGKSEGELVSPGTTSSTTGI